MRTSIVFHLSSKGGPNLVRRMKSGWCTPDILIERSSVARSFSVLFLRIDFEIIIGLPDCCTYHPCACAAISTQSAQYRQCGLLSSRASSQWPSKAVDQKKQRRSYTSAQMLHIHDQEFPTYKWSPRNIEQ